MEHLTLTYLPASALNQQSEAWRSGVLGCTSFSHAPFPKEAAGFPCVRVDTPVLPDGDELYEVWSTNQPLSYGQQGSIHYSYSDQLLFGYLVMSEADFGNDPSETDGATPLQRASEVAFREIFSLLDKLAYPYLWRVWNYFPEINRESHGLERYRQFNAGRQEGFQLRNRLLVGNVPAACALGSVEGHLTIYFLAGRKEPLPIENPRQVSAYHYPQEYGPRSPTFSRASLCQIGDQEILFISGTASIIGHRSEHIGDVAAQTRETLANIEAVIGEANRLAQHNRFSLQALCYKVYVRHPADLEVIQHELHTLVGPDLNAIYLRADVCREDLLVEIEATAGHPVEFL